MRLILGVLLFVASCGEEQGIASGKLTRCEQLREHLIDLRVATAPKADQAEHRKAMRIALGSDFLDGCQKLSDDEIACALDAGEMTSSVSCTSDKTEAP